MSEIRSISEGTFMIGQTSDLNFEAGTGIKITEPSEGTVRIANDETVIYDSNGATNISSCSFSESYKNFEKVKIYFRNSDGDIICHEVVPALQGSVVTVISGTVSTEPKLYMKISTYTLGNTSLAHRSDVAYTIGGNAISSYTTSYISNYVIRVIGINRISGGN